jgi:signal transduction histidine kinase
VAQLNEPQAETELDLVSPLTVQGEVIGQLGVTRSREILPEDVHLATALASQVSIHLETLRLNAELEKRAHELQELDRLKSAFLANMSHELRTPLNSILGFSDVMLEGLDGELTEYMDNDLRLIQKNGQHLLHLINDVLDMSKIESGRMNLNPETFNIYNTLEEVCNITSALASEKNIALYIEDDSEQDIEIYADDTRIRQVMINLVNNAIKFTEKGKIAISLKQLDNSRILITVKDTGTGIPPDKLEMVFQEFTQVDTSTTRKVGGTGLGLPISRRLVEMHGGRIWAESSGVDGEGSTFFVELPLEAKIPDVIEKQDKQHGNAQVP